MMVTQLLDLKVYPLESKYTLAFNVTLKITDEAETCCCKCVSPGNGGEVRIYPRLDNEEKNREILTKWEKYISTQRDDLWYECAKKRGWKIPSKEITKDARTEIYRMVVDKYEENVKDAT